MTTQVVKQTLENENELLEGMIDFVKQFRSEHFTDQAKFIRDSWARFLTDRHKTNLAQQKSDDAKLKKDFLSEIAQIGAYIHVTTDQPGYEEKWKVFLECERDISGYLFNQIG